MIGLYCVQFGIPYDYLEEEEKGLSSSFPLTSVSYLVTQVLLKCLEYCIKVLTSNANIETLVFVF